MSLSTSTQPYEHARFGGDKWDVIEHHDNAEALNAFLDTCWTFLETYKDASVSWDAVIWEAWNLSSLEQAYRSHQWHLPPSTWTKEKVEALKDKFSAFFPVVESYVRIPASFNDSF